VPEDHPLGSSSPSAIGWLAIEAGVAIGLALTLPYSRRRSSEAKPVRGHLLP
jgi:hypothetical protein